LAAYWLLIQPFSCVPIVQVEQDVEPDVVLVAVPSVVPLQMLALQDAVPDAVPDVVPLPMVAVPDVVPDAVPHQMLAVRDVVLGVSTSCVELSICVQFCSSYHFAMQIALVV
jgi:hypothetical protein